MSGDVKVVGESSSVVARANVMVSALGDGVALLDMQSSVYFQLNNSGAFIWELLSIPRTIADIATALSTEFDCPRDAAMADVIALVDDLAANQLVTIDGSDGS